MKRNKLLLIGWDAADWNIIWPLIAQGKMPALKKIIENGVYGNMSTMSPPYSPMLWTSVATGKTPDKHGILGFIEVTPDNKNVRPVTTSSRKTRALWNIFHNQGLKSNLVGWWPSFPAEPINGTIISDRFQKTHRDPKKQTPMSEYSIHPWSSKDKFKDLRMFPFEITEAHLLPFVPKARKVDQENHKGLAAIAKIVSENASVHNAATNLLRTSEWDFMAVYYDLIDHFCHSFMKYHPPKLPNVNQENFDIFKDAVRGAYIFQDMMLERKMKLIDDDTTVIIMSDHGFESGNKRIINMPKVQAAPALEHRQFGIFVASGPNIKKNEKFFGMGLIDVAPTILHHFGLPVGKDMDGKVNLDIFQNPGSVKYIDSWDKMAGDFAELTKTDLADALSDEETMQQLVDLGYVEKLDEKFETAIKNTRIDLKHNLARVYMGKKDFALAKEHLVELLNEEKPIDLAPFYMDLISISFAEKNLQQAQKYLDLVKKSNTEIEYNLTLIEAQILTEKGEYGQALKLLEIDRDRHESGQILYRIAKLKNKMGKFKDAKSILELAIEKEPQKAIYHTELAEILLRIGEYEEAAEYALTSIELVKYFPKAHYILGQALENLGDLENAKLAFEMATRLKPKEFHKAAHSLQNINERIDLKLNFKNDKISSIYRENQITIVSGLPRSGTSLMMQMLQNGGMETLIDEKREADISNPKGYYEYQPVMALYKDNSWLEIAQNKTIKVVAPLLKYLDNKFRYKIIFMNRDLDEVLSSQQKMLGKSNDVFPVKLFNEYQKLLINVDLWNKNQPGVEIFYVDYKDVLENPKSISEKIESFIGKPLNKEEMAKCVDKSLYRNKSKAKA
ncbi:alkaline phosphatase family protein [Aequorivita echinoideorum]|nr:alkaline phosphatase family protein [Aequorivita echinoideorum]